MSGDETPMVKTQRLTRRFGTQMAVDELTIAIQSGETFGLLGPNGAGKTTTLKMLTTLLRPTSGTAHVAGFDIVRQAADVRRVIGYVPQLISADGTLTGYENLLIFAKLYDIPRAQREQRVRDSLAFMDLTEAADKMVREYSGGMIRRLEIAQAVLHAPRVLFLDEPTVGLDPVARHVVWRHIEQLRVTQRITILLTTHYMEEAEALCQRLAFMHLGKIAALGTPDELKSSLGTDGATLDDVFAHYTGTQLDTGATYRETFRTRRTANRLG